MIVASCAPPFGPDGNIFSVPGTDIDTKALQYMKNWAQSGNMEETKHSEDGEESGKRCQELTCSMIA